MTDYAPNSLSQGSLHTTDTFIDSVMNKENRKHFFSGDASWWYIPLVAGGSGFLNSGFLGVVRGTFSSGTVVSGTSGALKILVDFNFCEN